MKKLLILLALLPTIAFAQLDIKKTFKFATFYGAVNGGNSISDVDVYSISNGLETNTVKTPFDYSFVFGVRKIARMGYEPKEAFKNGTENSYSDAATIGKVKGFEFLFEVDYKRQQGINYLDQNHFIRYVADNYIVKTEYLMDGFADVEYFEMSERYRYKLNKKFSFNIGAAQRLAEPYGYDPLEDWVLSNGNLHYTYLAINEMGYDVDVFNQIYTDPSGNQVATSTEVWEEVVIPQVLADYTEQQRSLLKSKFEYSLVVGFDYYHYAKDFWLHSWGNLMPYHYDAGGEFSYHNYNDGKQWMDYSGGLILGYKLNKHLGIFTEGKYNKYWNRTWHDFSVGINYVIF
jgi:hypothetical protein